MRNIVIAVLCSLLSLAATAQHDTLATAETGIDFFRLDNMGNIYLVKGCSVVKQNANGKIVATFDNRQFGNITDLDVSNPLKIIAFYKDFNVLQLLDNYLAPISTPILLDDLELYDNDAACSVANSGFALFDYQNANIKIFDNNLNISYNGTSLFGVINDQHITKIRETNNLFVLLFENGQMILLDKFGNFYDHINNLNISDFDHVNDDIFFIANNKLYLYKGKNIVETKTDFGHNELIINNLAVCKQAVIVLIGNRLIAFKIVM